MSFLNSIMASINGGETSAPSPGATSAAKSTPVRSRTATPNSSRPTSSGPNAAPRRKEEDLDNSSKLKAVRLDTGNTLLPPPSRSASASPVKSISAGSKPPAPYRGTGKSSTQHSAPTAAKPTTTRPGSASAAPASTAPAKPAAPKTGYLAVLERAKAAQEAAKQIGGIKHKQKEKLSRKDRERIQAEAAAAASRTGTPAARGGKQGLASRSKSSEPVNAKREDSVKKDRKPVDVGYKGTMRPVGVQQPSYRGTMQSGKAAVTRPGYGAKRQTVDYSDEEEDEEDDEQDYESGSSDMEAGRDDIDEEEEMSARIAKQEDLAALREEAEAKREKLERKRKLERLQAAAAAKKPRY